MQKSIQRLNKDGEAYNARLVATVLLHDWLYNPGLPRVVETSSGPIKVHAIVRRADEGMEDFDYVFMPVIGTFNVLNWKELKFDKTPLCEEIDRILVEQLGWPIMV